MRGRLQLPTFSHMLPSWLEGGWALEGRTKLLAVSCGGQKVECLQGHLGLLRVVNLMVPALVGEAEYKWEAPLISDALIQKGQCVGLHLTQSLFGGGCQICKKLIRVALIAEITFVLDRP